MQISKDSQEVVPVEGQTRETFARLSYAKRDGCMEYECLVHGACEYVIFYFKFKTYMYFTIKLGKH